MKQTRILGVAGSLRQRSINRALLNACVELMPEHSELSCALLHDLPLYNADLDGEQSPDVVTTFRDRVAAADGVLLVIPEYNHSVPGVLKNALDWASRPAFKASITHKPVGVMTASPGPVGGARAQKDLTTILMGMSCHAFPHPGFCLGRAPGHFDDQLNLINEDTRKFAQSYLRGFVDYVRLLQKQ